MRTCVFGKHQAMLKAGLLAAIMAPTGMLPGTAEASPATMSGHVGLHQLETSAQLVDRLLNLPDYVPDPRVKAEDQRTPLLRAIAPQGEEGAAALVARLLAMPSSAEDPQGTRNAMRGYLIRDIGALGDVAIKPVQDALGRAKTADQRRDMVQAVGAMNTAASTRALLSLLAKDDEAITNAAISSLTDRLGMPPDKGGSEDILPALVKIAPEVKTVLYRMLICLNMRHVLKPVPPTEKADERQVVLAGDLLRERLKNDTSADVRFSAACALTEFGDNSGLGELERAALAMQARGDATNESAMDQLVHEFALERLVPALERATGQKFGPVPLHPSLSSNLDTTPTLRAQRQELLEKIIVWIKANPRK